jgi:hypothetical protein
VFSEVTLGPAFITSRSRRSEALAPARLHKGFLLCKVIEVYQPRTGAHEGHHVPESLD